MRRATVLAGLLAAAAATASPAGAVEWTPRVGIEFDHFGETYRITDDQDTVATVDDLATRVGVTMTAAGAGPDRRLELRTDALLGQQGRQLRLDLDGRWRAGANLWEIEQDATWRAYADDGDYSVSGDVLEEWFRAGWERRLADRVRLRFRHGIDLTRYGDPDPYRLDSTLHRPALDVRFGFGDLSELRLGAEYGRRVVPDSTSLGYRRGVAEADLSVLAGWSGSLDVASRVERRIYPDDSVRGSWWEHRGDLSLSVALADRTTLRLLHENEWIRPDEPDALDFDSMWTRTGLQFELHRTLDLDLSLTPLYAFLESDSAPEEAYDEVAVEFGIDWRLGDSTWLRLTEEIGRRDYEIQPAAGDGTDLDAALAADDVLDTAWSDYSYQRLTLFVSSELAAGVAANLFVTWQPENHRESRHDTETRIVSGGVEYRFD